MRVYSLVAEHEDETGEAIRIDVVLIPLAERQSFAPEFVWVSGQDDLDVKHSARRGAGIAYQELTNKGVVLSNGEIRRSGITFDFTGEKINRIVGPSAGLCFLTVMACEIIAEKLRAQGKAIPSFDIAATGILASPNSEEAILRVDAIEAKVRAALAKLGPNGIILYPKANAPLPPALHTEAEQKQIILFAVETPRQVLNFLLKKYDGPKEWPDPKRKWVQLVFAASAIVVLGWLIISWLPFPPPPILPTCVAEVSLFREPQDGKPAESQPIPIDTGVLKSGEGFGVSIDLDKECHLYVFNVDSSNSITGLLSRTLQKQPVPPGKHWVPENPEQPGRGWAVLDGRLGEETVLIWASLQPSEWLEMNKGRIENSKDLSEFKRQMLRKELMDYLEREQREQRGTLRQLTFQHR